MQSSPFIKLCWLKTACGGWCTSVRLSTFEDRPCIFGCGETRDELCHYLQCPLLWQFALDSVGGVENNCNFLHRIGIYEPSVEKLNRLAFCHALYHTCVNDTCCVGDNGMPYEKEVVLARAAQSSIFLSASNWWQLDLLSVQS